MPSTFAGAPSVLWNPVIQTRDGSFGLSHNQFGFNITGTANIPVMVETCADLSNPVWSPLQTFTLTNGSVFFSQAAQAKPALAAVRTQTHPATNMRPP